MRFIKIGRRRIIIKCSAKKWNEGSSTFKLQIDYYKLFKHRKKNDKK